MTDYSDGFFASVERELDQQVYRMRQQLFSTYRNLPWTDTQRRALQPLLRRELDYVVMQILEIFDNVGCDRVPDGVVGYTINVLPDANNNTDAGEEGVSLRTDAQDYADAWREYRTKRQQSKNAC